MTYSLFVFPLSLDPIFTLASENHSSINHDVDKYGELYKDGGFKY